MNTSHRLLSVALVAGIALAVGPARAQQNTVCTTTLSSGTFENMIVPKGATCALNSGATVLSNVIVRSGATFLMEGAQGGATVNGNVVANDAYRISIRGGAIVGGNVQLVGTMYQVTIGGSNFGGNIHIIGTSPGEFGIFVVGNVVTGNVALVQNSSSMGIDVAGNTIGMNLICIGNSPAPSNGNDPNTVDGNKVGQCAGL